MAIFPVNLKVDGRQCTVIGGGQVALRKVTNLLACGARVKVISPALAAGFEKQRGRYEYIARTYRWGDLEGSFLTIAATDDDAVNRAVEEEAHARRMLLNVADKPEQCNFYIPSRIRRGDLLITVSTGGALPALAKRLRLQLEEEFPPAWTRAVELLGKARQRVLAGIEDQERKKQCLTDLAAIDLVAALDAGGDLAAQTEIDKCISRYLA